MVATRGGIQPLAASHELHAGRARDDVDDAGAGSSDEDSEDERNEKPTMVMDEAQADADEETAREAEMERTVKKTRRRMKMFGVFALVLGIFLAVSVACNFAVMFVVVDSQVT